MPSLVTIKHCVKGYWVKNCKMCPILLKKRTWILPLVYVKVLVSAYAALKPLRVQDMSMIFRHIVRYDYWYSQLPVYVSFEWLYSQTGEEYYEYKIVQLTTTCVGLPVFNAGFLELLLLDPIHLRRILLSLGTSKTIWTFWWQILWKRT